MLGIVVGALAGDNVLLKSNLVFRFVVGGIAAGFGYIAVVALWLAYHRRTFRRISAAGAGAEAPDVGEITARDQEINEFMDTTTKATEELTRRLEKLEEKE